MQVKQVTDEKVEQFVDAYYRLFNDEKNLLYLSFSNIPFSKELIQNWVKESALSGVEYYTAGENDQIEGILVIRFNTIESFEILALVVDSSKRRFGIGSLLVKTAIEKAKEKGFKAVDIAVFADNKKMLSLVIKNDFKPVKIEYHKRFDGEDVVILRRTLETTEGERNL